MKSAELERLRKKLLDVTGANRLISFKHTTAKSLRFVGGQPEEIFRRLVESGGDEGVEIVGLRRPSKDEWVMRNGLRAEPEPKQWAARLGIPASYEIQPNARATDGSKLQTILYEDVLASKCAVIRSAARLAIQETGANALFLSLGFLRYPNPKDPDALFEAPLVCAPTELTEKRSANGARRFFLRHTGEDIAPNLSLIEKMRQDFGVEMPIPGDKIDLRAHFAAVENFCRHMSGFSFKRCVTLSLLSFANAQIFRDLDPANWPSRNGVNALTGHAIVKELLEGVDGGEDDGGALSHPPDYPIDDSPEDDIPLVFEADSSQHSALIDVLSKRKNLVIEGPPGTGKSQTITNLIAACLAQGKKVLFVAEKMAALEVVKSKLRQAGLDPFVLQLHSSGVNRKVFLQDLSKRRLFSPKPPGNLPDLQKQKETARQDLKAYAELLRSKAFNSLGLTLHEVMWKAEKLRMGLGGAQRAAGKIPLENPELITRDQLDERLRCLRDLGARYAAIGRFDPGCAFWGFVPESSIAQNDAAAEIFEDARRWGETLQSGAERLARVCGGKTPWLPPEGRARQLDILRRFAQNCDGQLPLGLIPNFFADEKTEAQALSSLQALNQLIERKRGLKDAVDSALLRENGVTDADARALKDFLRIAGQTGFDPQTTERLESAAPALRRAQMDLWRAWGRISKLPGKNAFALVDTTTKLERMRRDVDAALDPPRQHWRRQSPALADPDAAEAIERLLALQNEWVGLERELSDLVYLDGLPDEKDVIDAIMTLKEGDRWYRAFQGKWRAAIRLHQRLSRSGGATPVETRLAQLNQIARLQKAKKRWKDSPTWERFVGMSRPSEPVPLEGPLAVAKWNAAAQSAAGMLQDGALDPSRIPAERLVDWTRRFAELKSATAALSAAVEAVCAAFRLLKETSGGKIRLIYDGADNFRRALDACLDWLAAQARPETTPGQALAGCEAALQRRAIEEQIQSSDAKPFLGDDFKGEDTDCAAALKAFDFGLEIKKLGLALPFERALLRRHPIEASKEIILGLEAIQAGMTRFDDVCKRLSNLGKFDPNLWLGTTADEDFGKFAQALKDKSSMAVRDKNLLPPWSDYHACRSLAIGMGLAGFVDLVENKDAAPNKLADCFEWRVCNGAAQAAIASSPVLKRLFGPGHNAARDDFVRLDKEVIEMRGRAVARDCALNAKPPTGNAGSRVGEMTEMKLLDHLMPQKRPGKTIRYILAHAGAAVQELKPCFMMGPQAVAQFLTPGAIEFDVVIMDEASQLTPENAVGAIARGKQLVVVGDPKQLPPTSFFKRIGQTDEEEEEDDQRVADAAESILDLCLMRFGLVRALRWHYRSRHQSLIAFSNRCFYDDRLMIYPSPYGQCGDLGLRAVYLADAAYENQTNPIEASRIADAVAEHILKRPNDSLGVVALNCRQSDLIEQMVEKRLEHLEEAARYKERWEKEGYPLFVKNLENVQGDERDAILISTTYGKPEGSSVVRQNFGPISQDSGWRRLNVLFTRAKKSIALYTSMRPEDIRVNESTPRGTRALRDYLEYVRSGTLPAAVETGREPDSEFEIVVMDRLKRKGYEVTPQLGVAGYRIDVAVKHPDYPGAYLAAIECDGATYHSARSVRDRDRIRQEILEGLGWRGRIWRIWSTDWFRNPSAEFERLLGFLDGLRRTWKPAHARVDSWVEERGSRQDRSR